jgi:hypothetical protein
MLFIIKIKNLTFCEQYMTQASTPFSNHVIFDQLNAAIEPLTFNLLDEKYGTANMIIRGGIFLFFAFLTIAVSWQPFFFTPEQFQQNAFLISGLFLLLAILVVIYTYLADKKKGYCIREQDISYRSGLIFRKIVTQPILRIQHVELNRGPVDRKIGLAKLQVFSAGGAMHTFEVPGLPLALAEKLRQTILNHKNLQIED